jgi:hypothetical protein
MEPCNKLSEFGPKKKSKEFDFKKKHFTGYQNMSSCHSPIGCKFKPKLKSPKPYRDAMSVSLWTQPTNEFRFQTLFPNLENRKF